MLAWLFGTSTKEQSKQSTKPKQQSDKWMYDLLIQFLSSPEWRINILNFVDQNCIVFDNEQQNKFQYTKIHNDFKKLISGLFDATMSQMGLTSDKLIIFIEKGLQSKHHKLFQQLLICDDFLKFKQLMVKRNKALTDQAIKQLQRHGTHSTLLSSKNIEEDNQVTKKMIQKTLKLSALSFKQRRKTKQQIEEEQMLKQAMEISAMEQKQRQQKQIKAAELEQKQHSQMLRRQHENQLKLKHEQEKKIAEEKQRKIHEHQDKLIQQSKKKDSQIHHSKIQKTLPPVHEKASHHIKKIHENKHIPQPHVQAQIPVSVPVVQQKKIENIEDRKKRLLEQRQLLKKKKMEQRLEELSKPAQKHVQIIVLDENGFNDRRRESTPEKQKQQKISEEQITRRRQLMRKIKNKIIDDI